MNVDPSQWPQNKPMPPTQPTGPNDPPFGYRPVLPPAPPPPKKSKKKWIILAVVAAACLLLFGGCVAFLGAVSESIDTTNKDIKQASAQKAPATTEAPVVDNENPYDTPKVSDFRLKVKTLTKECFGSAGCNITYRVVADWSQSYDPSIDYELTYRVTGPEDGAHIGTMTITGDEYSTTREESASTSSKYTALKVRGLEVGEA